ARAEPLLRKAIQLTGNDEARNNYQVRRAFFALGRILVMNGKREEGNSYLIRSRDMENSLIDKGRQPALGSEQTAPGQQLGASQKVSGGPVPGKESDPTVPIDSAMWQAAPIAPQEKSQAQEAEQKLRNVVANAYNDLGTS